MLNSSRRTISNVEKTNIKKKSIVNTNNKNQNENNSNKKSMSSEPTIYMHIKEKNGISLHTHIQTLLDMFIFQNPIQPVKYFEYYSEKLKEYYHKPQPDPDLDFLNNIESNTCLKIANLYKENKIRNENNQLSDDKINDKNIPHEDEMIRYENEYEYEEEYTTETNEVKVQDLSEVNYMFNKAGCGLTNDEVNLIEITMDRISVLGKFKDIRYWGKILGLKRNYYILECEWQDRELEYKLRILKSIIKVDGYGNIYENEEHMELENYLSMEYSNEQVNLANRSSAEYNEEINEENKSFSNAIFSSQIVFNKNFNKTSLDESELSDSGKSKQTCYFPSAELDADDNLSNEMIGFGANKKTYFVANQLSDDWIELPALKSHHIIQSRNIKRYFVGDLESCVKSNPPFQGLEKHYLRAQIARITAATQISPRNYFVLDNNNTKTRKWKTLSSFQLKVMSTKGVHDCVVNQNYTSPSVYALLDPNNWVHHVPMISDKGVTKAWTLLKTLEVYNNKNEDEENTLTEEEANVEYPTLDQDLFTSLSDDFNANQVPPWKFEIISPFDHMNSHVTTKSNIWPGAFVVTREKHLDFTYCGWGHKWIANDCTNKIPSVCQSEYTNYAKETYTEMKDPTHADESSFSEFVERMREEKRKYKIDSFKLFDNNYYEGEEEEEVLIKAYNYD